MEASIKQNRFTSSDAGALLPAWLDDRDSGETTLTALALRGGDSNPLR